MIIVNAYYSEDYDRFTDGFDLTLAAVVNDIFDIFSDPQMVIDAIENDDEFVPKAGQLYEIQLIRATIESDPIPEPALCIDRIIEKKYDRDFGWIAPVVRL